MIRGSMYALPWQAAGNSFSTSRASEWEVGELPETYPWGV
jgi:hypothetical protein